MTSFKLNHRAAFAFLHDVTASAVCWGLAFWLRFNLDVPDDFLPALATAVTVSAPTHALIFWSLGLYRGSWRYASLPDLRRIVFACFVGALAVPAVLAFFRTGINVPRSTFILAPLLLVAIMAGSRIVYRAWRERAFRVRLAGEPMLVIGAGDITVNLLKETERSGQWRAVGILDDDPTWDGRVLVGVRVLGPVSDIAKWARELQTRHAVIALPAASAGVRRRAAELASGAGLTVLTVPSYDDLLSGKITVSQIRRVELEDLLGREQVVLDNAGLRDLLAGSVVMITGAGGSIGTELCRQIAKFGPANIVMFELNEYALYSIDQEFRESRPKTPIATIIGDVRNASRVEAVMSRFKPSIVFHAAAYKHVPMMETENTWEAVQNNALGTLRVARASLEHGVEKFVLISTDKAVNPTNVMGATKRLSEQICQALQRQTGTRFLVVRFGNVVGSTGSVIPKFREQITRGGPVTVTHPEITRYFMSIPEAAQLVLQAGLMGKGGEIFVLEMGEPVKILDLARDMIRLSGFGVEDIPIEFTGLRPGEKLHEELLSDGERTRQTQHPKLRVAGADSFDAAWLAEAETWLSRTDPPDNDEVRRELARLVPGYNFKPDARSS